MTLGLTYIATGMLGALPSASLIRLASNTHVSLEVAGSMFTISAFGSMLGIVLSGFFMRYIQPKYLLMLGLFFLGSGFRFHDDRSDQLISRVTTWPDGDRTGVMMGDTSRW